MLGGGLRERKCLPRSCFGVRGVKLRALGAVRRKFLEPADTWFGRLSAPFTNESRGNN